MELYFSGACHEVTGSAHLMHINDKYILVDYGMEQGVNYYENIPLPVKFAQIDYILVTHAHIDHTGMLPQAYKEGFRGGVVCTYATAELLDIMLRDCAHIQEQETIVKNRKNERAGKTLEEPIYDMKDVDGIMGLLVPVHYGEMYDLCEGVKLRFADAGHILGSSSIEVWLSEDGVEKKIVFSGDIGNPGKPIIKDPQFISQADYVLMESTYGDRFHQKEINHEEDLTRIIQETLDRGGNVVIPAFAVGRTQEILYLIRDIKNNHMVKNHDNFKVVVDSPMAVKATNVYKQALAECYDEEALKLIQDGINPISFDNLQLCITTEESMALNNDKEPKVILSASGMADAGRIRHHIKYNVWREDSSIVFAGYQAEGTLGRYLLDGAKTVKLFGEEYVCKAHIEKMNDMSSHADRNGLIKWINAFDNKPTKIFLVHGDDKSMLSLSTELIENEGFDVECPYSGSIFDLANNEWINVAKPIEIVKAASIEGKGSLHNAYEILMDALSKLMTLAQGLAGHSNKELSKKTREINEIIKKWQE